MFKKVLVANRGEIAVRIIRTLKEMGIASVAIYSTADKDSLHVQIADEAISVGGPRPKDSYLNMKNILSAALLSGAEAIHPGYGFLAENSLFAEMVGEVGIKWIGPRPETIELMGNKANAREEMRRANVPIIPGSDGFIRNFTEAKEVANRIGYPLLLKAAAGGGGRACVLFMVKTNYLTNLMMLRMKRDHLMATIICISKRSWNVCVISRCKYFVMKMGM